MKDRPKQEVPAQLISQLMAVIKNQFFPDISGKDWGQQYTFIKREVVTWPAAWLNSRGVTLPPARYQQILLGVLNDVKIHGHTAAVRYWPGYLKKVMQDHFKHHGDEYYQEGKSIRSLTERSLMAFTRAQEATKEADPVATLAQVHHALKRPKPRQAPRRSPAQLDLL